MPATFCSGQAEAKSHAALTVSEELHLLESPALAFVTNSVWSRFACDLTHRQFSVVSAEAKVMFVSSFN